MAKADVGRIGIQIRRDYSAGLLWRSYAPGSCRSSRHGGESILLVPYPVENLGLFLVDCRRLRRDHAQEALAQARISSVLDPISDGGECKRALVVGFVLGYAHLQK